MASPSVQSLQRAFYSVALLIIGVVILYYAQIVFVPVALAILLTFILSPLVLLLERYGVWRWLGVVLVAMFAFAILGLILWIASLEVSALVREFPAHEKDFQHKLAGIEKILQQMQQLSQIGSANQTTPQTQDNQPQPTPVVIESRGSSYVSWIPAVAGPVVEILARVLLVIVLTIFMMAQRETLRDRLLRLVGQGNLTSTSKALDDAAERVSRFLLNQLGTNTFVGVGVTLGTYFLGIPNALLWGFLTIALRFIPYVGVWLAALLPFIVGVAFFPGWSHALSVLALYLFLELITGNFIEPLWFGHSTGVSPIALLIAAVFWAWLWGPVGLLMSTPLTVCLVVLGKHVPYLEFFDTVLGATPTLDAGSRFYHDLIVHDHDAAATLVQQFLAHNPPDSIYDQLFLPSLGLTKQAQAQRELTTEEQRSILRALRDLHALVPAPAAGPEVAGPRRRLVACTMGGPADEMALRLLRHFLEPRGWDVRIVTGRRTVGRVLALAREGWSSVVCVGLLPPGSATPLGNLCRQLHQPAPDLTILVGRWGSQEDMEAIRGTLQNAGATAVVSSFRELRDRLEGASPGVSPAQTQGNGRLAAPAAAQKLAP